MTVLVPVWDEYVKFLPEALASVRAQAVAVRVIVIDNASHRPVLATGECEVRRSNTRLSRGAIRNLGLEAVQSEYVLFLDADDVLLPGALRRLVEGLDRRPGTPVLAGLILEPGGRLHRTPRRLARALSRWPRAFAWSNATWSLLPTQGSTLLRTAAVRDAGGYADASDAEDWALAAALAFRGRIEFDSRPALIYSRRESPSGFGGSSRRRLLLNAELIRRCLAADPAVDLNWWRRLCLAGAQTAAVLVMRPLVRAVRQARDRVGTGPAGRA